MVSGGFAAISEALAAPRGADNGGRGASLRPGSAAAAQARPLARACCNALLRAYVRAAPPQRERASELLFTMSRCGVKSLLAMVESSGCGGTCSPRAAPLSRMPR